MSRIIEEMLAQERREARQEVAQRMLAAGKFTVLKISEISGLSIDEIKKLQDEN